MTFIETLWNRLNKVYISLNMYLSAAIACNLSPPFRHIDHRSFPIISPYASLEQSAFQLLGANNTNHLAVNLQSQRDSESNWLNSSVCFTGWWLTYPSEKYESQFGFLDDDISNIWKNEQCSKPPISETSIWANYNNSLTWIVRPFGDDFPY